MLWSPKACTSFLSADLTTFWGGGQCGAVALGFGSWDVEGSKGEGRSCDDANKETLTTVLQQLICRRGQERDILVKNTLSEHCLRSGYVTD